MVENIRISVAMTSYNGIKYIGEQLDSILIQLKENDEIVVSDDGSSDGTVELIEKYREKDKRVRLIKGPGNGIKKNVENAIKNTRGEFIFLADQDDIWAKEKIEHVMKIFVDKKYHVVIHDAQVFEGENTEKIVQESFLDLENLDRAL